MRLGSLQITNFQRVASLTLKPERPVILVCGENEAGKSSVAEAIGAVLGLDPPRVRFKKDYFQLVTDGAKTGSIALETDGSPTPSVYSLPSGKLESVHGYADSAAMKHILTPSLFAIEDEVARRAFLFRLMNVKKDKSVVLGKLKERAIPDAVIETVMGWVEAGFDYAATSCKEKATESRGAWKQITGETYGDKKAPTWKAAEPEAVTGNGDAAANHTAAALAHDDAQRELGRLQGLVTAHAGREERLATLRAQAAAYAPAKVKLEAADKLVAQWEAYTEKQRAALQKLAPAPTGPRAGVATSATDVACTACGFIGKVSDGKLIEYTPPTPVVDPRQSDPDEAGLAALSNAKAAVEKAEASLKAAKAHQKKLKAEADAGDAASKQLAAIEEIAGDAPTQAQIDDARLIVESAAADLQTARTALDAAQAVHRKREEAKVRTASALKAHEAVAGWLKAEEAMSPSGIPSELLGAALTPFNEKLAAHSKMSEWPLVQVNQDMQVVVGERLYGLRSESARWRADAILSVAIAQISQIDFVLLDRVDVNSGHNRKKLMVWLNTLCNGKELTQAWLFATLKEKPVKLPPSFECHWMAEGAVV